MLNLKNVLVVLDPEQKEQPALDKVASLARLADFRIILFSCEYTQYLVEGYYFDAVDLPTLRQDLLDSRREALEKMAAPLREQGLAVDTQVVWGHPAYATVIREAAMQKADLVVRHTRQHGAISRMLLSHDDWQLVRCCPTPLLLVKEKAWQPSPRVIAAVDPMHSRHKPSGLDHQILGMAIDLADLARGEAHVLHSYSQFPLAGNYPKDLRGIHGVALGNLVSGFKIPEDRQHLAPEVAEQAIAALQHELNADVVVMGAISRSVISDIFIGNTTEKALDFIECDILVMKPDDFVSPVQGG